MPEITIKPNDRTFEAGAVVTAAIRQLKIDEGWSARWYRDKFRYWTIGYGFKLGGMADNLKLLQDFKPAGEGLPSTPMTREQGETILGDVVYWLYPKVETLLGDDAWSKLNATQREALINMAFQLGLDGLRGFHKTLALIREGKYADAAKEAENSDWANSQTPARARRTARRLRA